MPKFLEQLKQKNEDRKAKVELPIPKITDAQLRELHKLIEPRSKFDRNLNRIHKTISSLSMIGALGAPTIAAISLIFGSHVKYYTLQDGNFTGIGYIAGGFIKFRHSRIDGVECKDFATFGNDLDCPSIDGSHSAKAAQEYFKDKR